MYLSSLSCDTCGKLPAGTAAILEHMATVHFLAVQPWGRQSGYNHVAINIPTSGSCFSSPAWRQLGVTHNSEETGEKEEKETEETKKEKKKEEKETEDIKKKKKKEEKETEETKENLSKPITRQQ